MGYFSDISVLMPAYALQSNDAGQNWRKNMSRLPEFIYVFMI